MDSKTLKHSWQSIKDELPKTILQVLISAVGFLLALAVNSMVANHTDREAYESILKSIKSEAASNKAILENSFLQYLDHGIVIKEFSLGASQQALANPLFVRQAAPGVLESMNEYIRDLSLANGYRRVDEALQLSDSEKAAAWISNVHDAWRENLKKSEESIDKLLQLK